MYAMVVYGIEERIVDALPDRRPINNVCGLAF
jgi:hypothetical protein